MKKSFSSTPSKSNLFGAVRPIFWLPIFLLLILPNSSIFKTLGITIPGLSNLLVALTIHIGLGLFCWLALKASDLKLSQFLGPLPKQYRWWSIFGWAIALWLFSIGTFTMLSYVLTSLFSQSVIVFLTNIAPTESHIQPRVLWVICLQAFLTIIVSPVIKELTFRGILFHSLSTRSNIQLGLWLMALFCTAAASLEFVGVLMFGIGAFVFNLFLGIQYFKAQTLWIPILIHAFCNAIPVVLALLPLLFFRVLVPNLSTHVPSPLDISSPMGQDMLQQAIDIFSHPLVGTFAILMLVLPSFFLGRFMWKNWPDRNKSLPYPRNYVSEPLS